MKKLCFILLMFILTFMYAFVVLCDTSYYHQGYYVVKNAFYDTNGDSFSNEYDWESLAWRDANDCMPCFRIDAIRDNRVWGGYRDGDYSEEIKFEGTAIKNNIINIETKNISMYDILNKERNGEDTNYSFVFDFKNIYSDNAINVNVKSSQIDSYTNKRFDSNNNYNLKLVNDDVIIFYELKQRIGEIKDVVLKNNSIKVILNGKELSFEQSPYIENGTTRVPMRYISEALGSEVNYNAQTKTITIRKGSTIIELITGSNIAKINGREMTLTTPVENRNGYTMVPLRFISEAFGAEVIWDESNKVITINLAEKTYPIYYNSVGYNTISKAIDENNVWDNISLNIKKIQPFIGLSRAMMETTGDAEYDNNYEVVGDALEFILSWINNSVEITKLNVTTGKDNTMNIKFGSPIESNYSGKKLSLDSLLVDKYYNYSPSIIFKSSNKADECIRNWFGLTGKGKYSMELNFGKVLLGDYGYYIVINGKDDMYQVPIINKNTTMKVYYTENGKTEFVFDAADKLRNARLPIKDEIKKEIVSQLENNRFIFD